MSEKQKYLDWRRIRRRLRHISNWYGDWTLALLRSSESTFAQIASRYDQLFREQYESIETPTSYSGSKPVWRWLSGFLTERRATIARGYVRKAAATWIFLGFVVGALVNGAAGWIVSQLVGLDARFIGSLIDGDASQGGTYIVPVKVQPATVLVVIFFAGFSTWGFELMTIMRSLIARTLGGGRQFGKLHFTSAAYVVPLAVVMGILRSIPFIGLYVVGVRALYGAFLSTLAIKAVYGFGWGKAIACNAVSITGATVVTFVFSPLFALVIPGGVEGLFGG